MPAHPANALVMMAMAEPPGLLRAPLFCPATNWVGSRLDVLFPRQFSCCGAGNYTDWRAAQWKKDYPDLNLTTPNSCCKPPLSEFCSVSDHPSHINQSVSTPCRVNNATTWTNKKAVQRLNWLWSRRCWAFWVDCRTTQIFKMLINSPTAVKSSFCEAASSRQCSTNKLRVRSVRTAWMLLNR